MNSFLVLVTQVLCDLVHKRLPVVGEVYFGHFVESLHEVLENGHLVGGLGGSQNILLDQLPISVTN